MALLLAVTLLIAGLAVITASVVPHFIDEASLSARDQLVREQVNNNLFYQAKIMELEAAKKESENRFQAPAVGESIFVKNQNRVCRGMGLVLSLLSQGLRQLRQYHLFNRSLQFRHIN